jgi:hypothetical protein
VGGQLHALAALFLEKESLVLVKRRIHGLQKRSERFGKEK